LLPKLISFGTYYLPTYGVLVALGFLTGLWVTVRLARRSGLNSELITNLAIYAALAGLLGAKLLMIWFDWPDVQIFSLSFWQAAAYLYMRHNKLPLLESADAFAPGVAIGHAIGRLGCFAAGCCWGKTTNLPWAVTFHNPDAWALTGVPLEMPLQPSQLYEFSTEALLFGFLYWRYGRKHEPGQIIGLYLVLSSVARFLIEFTRFHEQALPFGLPLSITQWISIGLALAGAALLVRPGRATKASSRPVHA